MKPLDGLLVLDMSIFLAGPLCALRLGDLGARVIKIERPDGGDLCRQLYICDTQIDGESMLFHAINRNKQSFAADFKNPADLQRVRKLIARADVLIANFRPGVMEKFALDYPSVRQINPGIVYGSISGYGNSGPWKHKPGQDLLAQALSGVMWLSGDGGEDAPPVPMGLAVADMFAGHFLAQGILAALIRRGKTGQGALVETSLLESLIDFQFEVLTTHLNDGGKLPQRSEIGNAHAYLAAPYGVYRTSDGWLAVAMNPLERLADLLDLPALRGISRQDSFRRRDQINRILADRFRSNTTAHWLAILEPADVWCSQVLDWSTLLAHEAFGVLQMTRDLISAGGTPMRSLACPIRFNGRRPVFDGAAPPLGSHTQQIIQEFGL